MTWAHGRHPAGRMPQDGSWKMVRCRMRCRRVGRCKTAAAGRTATEGPPPGCHRTGCRCGQEPAAGPFASGRSSLSASAPGAGLPVPVPSGRQGLRPSPCCRDTGPGPRTAALWPCGIRRVLSSLAHRGDICLFRARHRCTAWRFPSLPAVTARTDLPRFPVLSVARGRPCVWLTAGTVQGCVAQGQRAKKGQGNPLPLHAMVERRSATLR